MTVKTEITAYDLIDNLWSGGLQTVFDLALSELEQVMDGLEEIEPTDGYTLTDINDFFWFERDAIAEWLGFDDYDELLANR